LGLPLSLREYTASWLRLAADRIAPPLGRQAPSAVELEHARWIAEQGDKTLRLNYPLTTDSVVLDIGGYEGQWASDIFSRYLCSVHLFEPVPHFADRISHRFRNNPSIQVHRFGLSATDREEPFSVGGHASSALRTVGSADPINVVFACGARVLKQLGIHDIALAKINIEGGEYELLQHFIDTAIVKHIGDLQIQFHDFVPEAEVKMSKLQDQLRATHYLTYQYKFIWENWRRK